MSSIAKRPKLFIVEDDAAYQEIYQEMFRPNYDLHIAGNREDALAVLRKQGFDVALIDMRLKADERGNTDGLGVAQFIRDMGYSTEIILKSGFPIETPEIDARIKKLKPFAVLDKAAEGQVRQLLETVAQAAAKQMASSR